MEVALTEWEPIEDDRDTGDGDTGDGEGGDVVGIMEILTTIDFVTDLMLRTSCSSQAKEAKEPCPHLSNDVMWATTLCLLSLHSIKRG